jgi:hypothetical protein
MLIASMLLPLVLGLMGQTTTVQPATAHAASTPSFIGLSGYPTSTTQVQNIINTMHANGLNTYRMSFNPEWFSSRPHPYRSSYIQYFLDHSNYLVIVDRNHLYPPTEASAATARSNWDTVRSSIFEVLKAFPNNPRVAVELINEYVSSDFYSRMQALVTEIRDAGYTNPLVVNKWNQPWTVIKDPLNNIYQGYHFYFNTWSVSGALSQMNTARSRGIQIINTEIGADYREYRYFTTSTVGEVNSFVSQSASLGIGNMVWMNENLNNWHQYEALGLELPTASTPPTDSSTSTPTPTPSPEPTRTYRTYSRTYSRNSGRTNDYSRRR